MDFSKNLIFGIGNEVLVTFIIVLLFSIFTICYLLYFINLYSSNSVTYYSNRLSRNQFSNQNIFHTNETHEKTINHNNENNINIKKNDNISNEASNSNDFQEDYFSIRHYGTDNQCPICLIPNAILPLETNCGHLFCANCIINFWKHNSPLVNMNCPVCRQPVSILLQCFTFQNENISKNADLQNILHNLNDYNRRFSQSRLWLDYIWDLPILLRHLVIEFLNGDLVFFFRIRIIFCVLTALMYLISPLDIIPEAMFGLFGFLDDIFLIILISIYLTIIYRRVLARRYVNE